MTQLFEFISNHPVLIGLFAVLLALFIRNETQRGGRNVSTQELVNLINHQGAIVLDVRDVKEFAAGHIVDAVNIPHGALEGRLVELEKYKEKPLMIVCKMGQQSGASGAMLRKAGFTEISRLTGGMSEWRNQNLPVVKG